MSVLTLPRLILAVSAMLQATPWVDPASHHVQLVTVEPGAQLEVLDFGGTGRAIVLLAGLGNTAHVFDEFAPKLTSLGHVYAITRRGYGASSRPESGYDVSRLGEDVLGVLDGLHIEKAVLIGHSIAGQELTYLASAHRDRVAALIYLEAAYRYAYDVPVDLKKDFWTLAPATIPASAPPPLPEAERRQPTGSVMVDRAILAGGRQFTKIDLPTLAIFASPHDIGAATRDPTFEQFDEGMTEGQARAFERGVPSARVLRWPHASHYLFLTRQADVVKEVTGFIVALR